MTIRTPETQPVSDKKDSWSVEITGSGLTRYLKTAILSICLVQTILFLLLIGIYVQTNGFDDVNGSYAYSPAKPEYLFDSDNAFYSLIFTSLYCTFGLLSGLSVCFCLATNPRALLILLGIQVILTAGTGISVGFWLQDVAYSFADSLEFFQWNYRNPGDPQMPYFKPLVAGSEEGKSSESKEETPPTDVLLLSECFALEIENGFAWFDEARIGDRPRTGDTAHVECYEGFQLLGRGTLKCLESGKYNDSIPECASDRSLRIQVEPPRVSFGTETIQIRPILPGTGIGDNSEEVPSVPQIPSSIFGQQEPVESRLPKFGALLDFLKKIRKELDAEEPSEPTEGLFNPFNRGRQGIRLGGGGPNIRIVFLGGKQMPGQYFPPSPFPPPPFPPPPVFGPPPPPFPDMPLGNLGNLNMQPPLMMPFGPQPFQPNMDYDFSPTEMMFGKQPPPPLFPFDSFGEPPRGGFPMGQQQPGPFPGSFPMEPPPQVNAPLFTFDKFPRGPGIGGMSMGGEMFGQPGAQSQNVAFSQLLGLPAPPPPPPPPPPFQEQSQSMFGPPGILPQQGQMSIFSAPSIPQRSGPLPKPQFGLLDQLFNPEAVPHLPPPRGQEQQQQPFGSFGLEPPTLQFQIPGAFQQTQNQGFQPFGPPPPPPERQQQVVTTQFHINAPSQPDQQIPDLVDMYPSVVSLGQDQGPQPVQQQVPFQPYQSENVPQEVSILPLQPPPSVDYPQAPSREFDPPKPEAVEPASNEPSFGPVAVAGDVPRIKLPDLFGMQEEPESQPMDSETSASVQEWVNSFLFDKENQESGSHGEVQAPVFDYGDTLHPAGLDHDHSNGHDHGHSHDHQHGDYGHGHDHPVPVYPASPVVEQAPETGAADYGDSLREVLDAEELPLTSLDLDVQKRKKRSPRVLVEDEVEHAPWNHQEDLEVVAVLGGLTVLLILFLCLTVVVFILLVAAMRRLNIKLIRNRELEEKAADQMQSVTVVPIGPLPDEPKVHQSPKNDGEVKSSQTTE